MTKSASSSKGRAPDPDPDAVPDPDPDPDFEILVAFLREERGFDFAGYKRGTLTRRVRKRMADIQVDTFADYREYLEVHPDEFQALFDTILINVTHFFRDEEAWAWVAQEVIPRIIAARSGGQEIRIWSAGCASGEEAYTVAMLFADALGPEDFARRVKIYGTDVDEDALATARRGVYSAEALERVPERLRATCFQPTNGDGFAFRSELRRAVIFGRHDITADAPISRLDLLVCRNTLMYFNAEAQAQILHRFHFALRKDGFLFLGRAEMLLNHLRILQPVAMEHRVFQKTGTAIARGDLMAPLVPARLSGHDVATIEASAFEASTVPQMLIDAHGRILTGANGAARAMFGLGTHDVGRPFRDLDVSFQPRELRGPIEQALIAGTPVVVSAPRGDADSGSNPTEVLINPLIGPEGDAIGASLTFIDIADRADLQRRLARAKEELETTSEELHSTNEELETTNEELHSTNEELETTNEELQSTNEELETMNEELHSTNEQLESVNRVLAARGSELELVNLRLASILAGVSAAIVVLDRDFAVTVWNSAAEDLWGLAADRVEGRNFLSLDIGLGVHELSGPVRSCLDDGQASQEMVLDAVDRRGQAIRCHVTISPLAAPDGTVHGVVLLMEPT